MNKVFNDIIGEQSKVLVLFDTFDSDIIKTEKPFNSKFEKHLIKEIKNRGFKEENLYYMYIKNKINKEDIDLISKNNKSKIQIKEEDIISFRDRFFTILNNYNIQTIIILGKNVSYILESLNLYKAESCYQKLEKKNIFGKDLYVIETISPFDYDLSMTNRNKFLECLNLVYSNLFELKNVQNASFTDIDTFSRYLKKCLFMYQNGMIDSIGFDLETNSKEWYHNWSKIIAISVSDKVTNHAFSCALYHPEKIMCNKKKKIWKWFFNKIYNYNYIDEKDFIYLTNKIEQMINKTFPLLEEEPYKEVFNDDEYFVFDNIILLIKSLKKKVSIEEKQNYLREFKININKQMLSLRFLINDYDYEKKIKEFFILLNDVLSTIPVIGHNVKFDIGWCSKFCIGLNKLKIKSDTYGQAVNLLGQSIEEKKDLENLSVELLGIENKWKTSFKSCKRLGSGENKRFDRVPLRILGPYSAEDAIVTDMLNDYFSKDIKGTVLEKIDKEQNLASVMFSYGEIHGFTVHSQTCSSLYKNVVENLKVLRNELENFSIVKKFVADKKEEIKDNKKDFVFNTNTSGAQSHNSAVLFRKEYYGLKSLNSTLSGFPSTDVDTLKEIKNQLDNSLKKYEESSKTEIVICENNKIQITEDNYNLLKEASLFCDNLIKTSSFNQLNNMYYKESYDEKKDKPLDKFITTFNFIGATKTGRLSSRFHLVPKTGGVRYMYCSAWSKDSLRKYQLEHKPSETYEPYYGLLDIEYEDGTKEKVSYDTLLKRGYSIEEIKNLISS